VFFFFFFFLKIETNLIGHKEWGKKRIQKEYKWQ